MKKLFQFKADPARGGCSGQQGVLLFIQTGVAMCQAWADCASKVRQSQAPRSLEPVMQIR